MKRSFDNMEDDSSNQLKNEKKAPMATEIASEISQLEEYIDEDDSSQNSHNTPVTTKDGPCPDEVGRAQENEDMSGKDDQETCQIPCPGPGINGAANSIANEFPNGEEKKNDADGQEEADKEPKLEEPMGRFGSFGVGVFGGASTGTVFSFGKPMFPPQDPVPASTDNEEVGVDFIDMPVVRPDSFPGEEDEEVLFADHDSSLFQTVKITVEGISTYKMQKISDGCMRVLKDKVSGSARVVFRTENIWSVALNAPTETLCKFSRPKSQVFKFIAYDIKKEQEDEEENKYSVFAVKFFRADAADLFFGAISQFLRK